MRTSKFWIGVVAVGAFAACAGDGATDDGDGPDVANDRATATDTALPGKVASAAELARMQQFVRDRIDPSTVRATLHEAGGRGIDCVDINEQPAMRAARARGEKLATPPFELDKKPAKLDLEHPGVSPVALYGADGAIASCPTGSVPIPQVTLDDLTRFATLDDYTTKSRYSRAPKEWAGPDANTQTPDPYGPSSQHQYAHAYRFVTNWGAEASLAAVPMYTELTSEFSLGQLWVVGGSGAGTQTLEVGLQHYQQLYGDAGTHLFIYSTNGGYAAGTGCYNNSCGDFVQVSTSWYPAANLGPLATPGGAQYELNVHFAKAGDTGDWWVSIAGQWMGYYPRARYSAAGVINHAAIIDFGGEIIDGRTGGRHTTTDMQMGYGAASGWTYAGYQRVIRYNDSNPSGAGITWAEATSLTGTQDDGNCYSIAGPYYNDPNWHTYFWYGGPGYNAHCQ